MRVQNERKETLSTVLGKIMSRKEKGTKLRVENVRMTGKRLDTIIRFDLSSMGWKENMQGL